MKSNIFSGFLFDKNWEASMRKLKPKQFHQLFWELYDYQMSKGRIKIPPHPDNPFMSMVVSFIEPQILNRLYGAKVFSKLDESHNPLDEQSQGKPPPTTGGDPPPTVPPTTPKLSQVEPSQVDLCLGKQSRAKLTVSEVSQEDTPLTDVSTRPPCTPQESEKENMVDENPPMPDLPTSTLPYAPTTCPPCTPPESEKENTPQEDEATLTCLPCLPQERKENIEMNYDHPTPEEILAAKRQYFNLTQPSKPTPQRQSTPVSTAFDTVGERFAPPETSNPSAFNTVGADSISARNETSPQASPYGGGVMGACDRDGEGISAQTTNAETIFTTVGEGSPLPQSKPETSPDRQQKRGYGAHGQVMLTPEEFEHLTKDVGIPMAYIDHFEERNAQYNNRIQNHAETIAAWWDVDRHKPKWLAMVLYELRPPEGASSFEVDEFYQAAVKQTFGYDLEGLIGKY